MLRKGTDILAVGESLSDTERAEWPPEGWMISDRSVQPNAVIVPLPEWQALIEAAEALCQSLGLDYLLKHDLRQAMERAAT